MLFVSPVEPDITQAEPLLERSSPDAFLTGNAYEAGG